MGTLGLSTSSVQTQQHFKAASAGTEGTISCVTNNQRRLLAE
jgi:hypothetical protein